MIDRMDRGDRGDRDEKLPEIIAPDGMTIAGFMIELSCTSQDCHSMAVYFVTPDVAKTHSKRELGRMADEMAQARGWRIALPPLCPGCANKAEKQPSTADVGVYKPVTFWQGELTCGGCPTKLIVLLPASAILSTSYAKDIMASVVTQQGWLDRKKPLCPNCKRKEQS